MTARDEALALLRERFPEPWEVRVAYFGKESGPIFFGLPECQWQARAELLQPVDHSSRDNVTLYAWRESPQEAARACVAAWDEATRTDGLRLDAAAAVWAAHNALDAPPPSIAAERALADRLGEALEQDVADGENVPGLTQWLVDRRALLAAWREARGKA